MYLNLIQLKRTRFSTVVAATLSVAASTCFFRANAQSNKPASMPQMTVNGASDVAEEMKTGPYSAPDWTQYRRFPTTRVYLQKAPWEAGVEQWWRGRFFRDGSAVHKIQEEIEVGLPHRFQFDLYETWTIDSARRVRHNSIAPELRWAPADWGKIPLNPTVYGEWTFTDKSVGPDLFEIKLLLGEELAPRWHWGLNAAWEQEVGVHRATELAVSQAVSYTLVDQKFGIGAEMVFRHESEIGTRSRPDYTFLVGPSAQWHITPKVHLDIVPLVGTTAASPRVESYVVLSIDIWPGEQGPSRPHGPTSTRASGGH